MRSVILGAGIMIAVAINQEIMVFEFSMTVSLFFMFVFIIAFVGDIIDVWKKLSA